MSRVIESRRLRLGKMRKPCRLFCFFCYDRKDRNDNTGNAAERRVGASPESMETILPIMGGSKGAEE
jgi:hypothetical protein